VLPDSLLALTVAVVYESQLLAETALTVAVCSSLVAAGERQDEDSVGGHRRSQALMMLTEMCPSQALTIRSLCVRTNMLFACSTDFC